MRPKLIVFGGLPGTGKTTISKALAKISGAVHLRIDAIEQAIKNVLPGDIGAAGYVVANAMAEENLKLGHNVIADCVNPVAKSRNGWKDTAARSSAVLIEIEVICSDADKHRKRVENRSSDIPGHKVPDWDTVTNYTFEPWKSKHLILDTANLSPQDAIDRIEKYVLGFRKKP